MVYDRSSRSKNGLILDGIKLSQFFGKNFLHMTTQQFLLVAAAAAFNERLVEGGIAATGIFDEKSRLREMIEELLDDGQFGGERGRGLSGHTGKR